MKKASVLRYAAIGMATLSLAGFAAASTVSLGTTGPDSNNQVDLTNSNTESTSNTNALGVTNFNAQGAETGDVNADHNTTVDGDLASGAADNSNSSDTSVSVSNSSSNGAAAVAFGDDDVDITETGPDSNNEVTINNSNSVTTENTNVVEVANINLQYAKSGNVNADHNTTVGGLTSGDATNTSSSTTTIDVSND